MYDVFFISYKEPNCEENWQRVLTLHPEAKRIDKIQGIDVAHMMCHDMSNTDKFWTIDGDNWLFKKLDFQFDTDGLIFLNSLDVIDGVISSVGSVKLWTKDSLINTNMSKGDFCKNATKEYQVIDVIASEHRYNTTINSTWKTCFRHMVKCYSGIITHEVLKENIQRCENFEYYDDGKNNAIWGHRAFLDAREYVEQCNGDFDKINLINDYDWLETKSNVCVEDWQKL